jgi:2-polyprenyl-6-methoxyphenol hydroxylase-like FAD-dependent oxidoreductase
MSVDAEVLIAGAGPVGLSAALVLGGQGVRVILCEAAEALPNELRASTFHPPTLDMLAPFGVTDAMLAQGLICPTWQVRMHPSGDRAVFDLSVLAGETAHPYRLQCEQSKLAVILLDKVRALPTVDVRFASRVVDVAQAEDRVSFIIEERSERRTLTARYAVGADGARSAVRTALGIEFPGDMYPETTILATTTFPFETRLDGISNVSYCWKANGTFSLLRLPGVWRTSLYARDGKTLEETLTDDGIQDLMHDIVPLPGRFDVLETRPYRIHQRIAATYRQGRVFLAGDAAHLNSPSGGMGMNGGIHDAFNLAEKLVAVLRGGDERDLDLYERQRRPIAQDAIIAQAHQNRTRMQERDPERRRALLADLHATTRDPAKLRAYLLRTSMIDGLRRAAAIH